MEIFAYLTLIVDISFRYLTCFPFVFSTHKYERTRLLESQQMGWSPRMVIFPPCVAWSAATNFHCPSSEQTRRQEGGPSGPVLSLIFSGMSPSRSLLPSSPPCSPILPSQFPFPSMNMSAVPTVLTNWCQDRGREGWKIPLVHHSQLRPQSLWLRLRHTPSGSPYSRSPHSFPFPSFKCFAQVYHEVTSLASLCRVAQATHEVTSLASPCRVFLPFPPRFLPFLLRFVHYRSPHIFSYHYRPHRHCHCSQRAPAPLPPPPLLVSSHPSRSLHRTLVQPSDRRHQHLCCANA